MLIADRHATSVRERLVHAKPAWLTSSERRPQLLRRRPRYISIGVPCHSPQLIPCQTTTTSSPSSAASQNTVTYTTVSFATQTYTTSYGVTSLIISTAPGAFRPVVHSPDLSSAARSCFLSRSYAATGFGGDYSKGSLLTAYNRLNNNADYGVIRDNDGPDDSPHDNYQCSADDSAYYDCVDSARCVDLDRPSATLLLRAPDVHVLVLFECIADRAQPRR